MKRVLFIGLSVILCLILSVSVFAIDSTYTPLDLIPLNTSFTYDVSNNSTIYNTTTITFTNNGLSANAAAGSGWINGNTYWFGIFSDAPGDYLFNAVGMSLYEFCVDVSLATITGTPPSSLIESHPVVGAVRLRFLDENGAALSSWVENFGESSDHYKKYFKIVFRETYDVPFYGFEIEFVSDRTTTVLMNNNITVSDFGWKYSTGTDTVQEAIQAGVDVLVYGSASLQRLNQLGFESFDEFVEADEFYWQYIYNGFEFGTDWGIDELFSSSNPAKDLYQNGFQFINTMFTSLFHETSHLPIIIRIAVSLGILGALFGIVSIVVSRSKGGKE